MKTLEDFYRPSSIAACDLCEGRPRMEAAVANMRETRDELTPEEAKEAALGTAAHNICASVAARWQTLRGERRLVDIADEQLGQIPPAILDRWTRACVRWSCEYRQALIDQYRPDPEDVLIEQHLAGDEFGISRGGTADFVIVIPYDLVIVVDDKYGFLDKGDASQHDQLASYAIMAAHSFHCREVIIHLVQPRAERDRRATAAKFNAATILRTAEWTCEISGRVRDPNAELHASYDACQTCSALPFCLEARSYIMRAIEAAEMIEPSSPADWGRLCDAVKLAGKWSEDTYKLLRQYRESNGPGSVLGWKLQAGAKQSDVPDTKEAMKRALELGLIEQFAEAIKVSAPKLLAMSDEHRGVFAPLVREYTKKPSLMKGAE